MSPGRVTPVINVGLMGVATEQLGIDAVAFDLGSVRCRNFLTGQLVERRALDGGVLNCEAEGFQASPNDPVSITFAGPALFDARGGGIARGMTLIGVQCENRTTGQSVDIDQPADRRDWNCVDAGLVVTTGDIIAMTAAGTAD